MGLPSSALATPSYSQDAAFCPHQGYIHDLPPIYGHAMLSTHACGVHTSKLSQTHCSAFSGNQLVWVLAHCLKHELLLLALGLPGNFGCKTIFIQKKSCFVVVLCLFVLIYIKFFFKHFKIAHSILINLVDSRL